MSTMQIALKGGAVIEVDVAEVETSRNRATGELTRITWEHMPDARRRLHTVEISEIAAIVFVDDEDEDEPARLTETVED